MNLRPLSLALTATASLGLFSACSPVADEAAPAVQVAPAEVAESAEAAPSPPRAAARRETAEPSGRQYKYINERGQVQVAARLEDIPESQRSTVSAFEKAAIPSRPAPPPSEDVRDVRNADVTIFTTRSCGYCRAAIAYFEDKGISYENRDVQTDAAANKEYLELTGGRRGVPVIVVGEQWMQGWSQQGFDNLLASAE
jgi:glutaredoxin 3